MAYVSVDIGATNIRVASGDINNLIMKLSEPTDRFNGATGVAEQITRMVRKLEVDPRSIGIGTIGPLDVRKGMIGQTPNFPFKNIPITEPLENEFGVPIKIINDCNAAVIGEHRFGAGKGIDNLFYVTVSTGLGGGAIVDGHSLGGKDGNAPEIGHLVIDLESELICGCGGRGHWEAYCSGANIPRFAKFLIEKHGLDDYELRDISTNDFTGLTSEVIFEAAKRGVEPAIFIVKEIGKINAVGFADIVNAFDPEIITVGGSIALNNQKEIIEPIESGIDEYLINRKPRIMITPLGADAVLYGGLAVALEIS